MRRRIQPRASRLGWIALLAASGLGCDREGGGVAHDSGTPASEPAREPEPVVAPPIAVVEPTPTPTLRPHGFAVVRNGAALRPGTDASASPLRVATARGFGLTVAAVGVKGGLVVVESGAPGNSHCAGWLGELDDFRLQWLVAPDDLATVTAKRITVPFADGTKIELLAGVPLTRDGEAWIAEAFAVRVRVVLPADAIDRFYEPGDRDPSAAPRDAGGLRQTGSPLVYDGGRVLEATDQLEITLDETPLLATFGQRTLDGRTLADVRARCIAMTVEAPSDRLARPEDYGAGAMFGMMSGSTGGGSFGRLGAPVAPRWEVEPGAAVHDPGGAVVGQVERAHVFDVAPIDRDARRCFTVSAFESAALELCFAASDVHELPGSSAAPTELGVGGLGLGLGLGEELGGVIGGSIAEDPGAGLGGTPGGFGSAPAKPSAKVRGGGSKAEVTGSLAPEIVRRHVKRHLGEVRSCYEKALAAEPSLAGKLTLTFTIRPDGTVSSPRISASTLAVDEVGDCVVAASKRWTFPAPEGGGAVVVSYPFVFASAG